MCSQNVFHFEVNPIQDGCLIPLSKHKCNSVSFTDSMLNFVVSLAKSHSQGQLVQYFAQHFNICSCYQPSLSVSKTLANLKIKLLKLSTTDLSFGVNPVQNS